MHRIILSHLPARNRAKRQGGRKSANASRERCFRNKGIEKPHFFLFQVTLYLK
jgi:hypothetical protein